MNLGVDVINGDCKKKVLSKLPEKLHVCWRKHFTTCGEIVDGGF